MTSTTDAPAGPGLLDALSLASEVADGLVLATVRDTHLAWVDRVHGLLDRPTGGAATYVELAHRGVAGAVYGGLGVGLRAASAGLDAAATAGAGPRLEATREGRLVSAVVNGLIGDRIDRDRPGLAIPMAVRVAGRDVPPDRDALAAAYPDASPRVAVFLHGLCENEDCWDRDRDTVGTTYPEAVAEDGWTPVRLRANSGLPLRVNGVALSSLLQALVDAWPVPVERVALVGHSMGGLVFRAAGAVASDVECPWPPLVSDVVTLGTPHAGAHVAQGVGHGSRLLARLPEAAAFGRILDWRSVGVHDLVEGLAEDVPALPDARYRLVSATLTRSPRHPVGALVGDLLVRTPSAHGRRRGCADLFPDASILHVGRAGHFDLLNHPDVHTALRGWLA